MGDPFIQMKLSKTQIIVIAAVMETVCLAGPFCVSLLMVKHFRNENIAFATWLHLPPVAIFFLVLVENVVVPLILVGVLVRMLGRKKIGTALKECLERYGEPTGSEPLPKNSGEHVLEAMTHPHENQSTVMNMTKQEFISTRKAIQRYASKVAFVWFIWIGLFLLWPDKKRLWPEEKNPHGTDPLFATCFFVFMFGGFSLLIWLVIRYQKKCGFICPHCGKIFLKSHADAVVETGKCGRCGGKVLNDTK